MQLNDTSDQFTEDERWISSEFDWYEGTAEGDTATTVGHRLGVKPFDVVFLNAPLYGPELTEEAAFPKGARLRIPKKGPGGGGADAAGGGQRDVRVGQRY